MDPLMVFGPQGVALAVMLMAATQVLKETFGLAGRRATLVAVLLGILLGVFGLRGTAATVLPDAPMLWGAVILGAFLGLIASGGYKLIGWFQENGAVLRAKTTPVPQVQVTVEPPVGQPCADPPAGVSPGAVPPIDVAFPIPARPLDPRGGEIEALPASGVVPRGFLSGTDDGPSLLEDALTHPAFTLRED